MKHSVSGAVLGLFCVCVAVVPVLAHHSFAAEFDGQKLVTLTGTLVRLEWQNPHVWFYMDVKDDSGKVTRWAIETASPNPLRRGGITREMFHADMNKVISVNVCPAKNGTPRAAAEDVKFANGQIRALGGKRYSGELDSVAILKNLK